MHARAAPTLTASRFLKQGQLRPLAQVCWANLVRALDTILHSTPWESC